MSSSRKPNIMRNLGEEHDQQKVKREYHHSSHQQSSIKEEEKNSDESLLLIDLPNEQHHQTNSYAHYDRSPPLKCKEEDDSSIITPMNCSSSSSSAAEHERLIKLAEQSLRQRNVQEDGIFLELERRVLNEEEETAQEGDNSREEDETMTPATKNEDDMMTGEVENEELGAEEDGLVLTEDGTRPSSNDERPRIEARKEPPVVYNLRSRKRRNGAGEEEERGALTLTSSDDEDEDEIMPEEEEWQDENEDDSDDEDDEENDIMSEEEERQDENEELLVEEGPDIVDKKCPLKRPRVEAIQEEQLITQEVSKKRVVLSFEGQIDKLRGYRKQHGTTKVSQCIDKRLYSWLHNQKVKNREGTLSNKQAAALEEEGVDLKFFIQKKKYASFEEWLVQLRDYKKQHGTINVRHDIDKALYNWLCKQQRKHREGTLPKKNALVLEKEGIDFKVSNLAHKTKKIYHTLEEWIDQLRAHKKEHGTTHISLSINERLYDWLHKQKLAYRKGTLAKEFAVALKEEGIDLKSNVFEKRVSQLREFKKQHGTAYVSSGIDKKLNKWLYDQRVKYRKGTLLREHASILEEVGVDLKK